jgi:hypothetical protein
MHADVAIPESLALTQVLLDAHEVYMTAVENFTSHQARNLLPRAVSYRDHMSMTDEELAESRKAFHGNEFGKLIVHLHGNADPLVWHTLNDIFRISQDPRGSYYTTLLCFMLDTCRSTPKKNISINKFFASGF